MNASNRSHMYSGVSTLGLAQHPSADSTFSLQTVYNNATQLHLSCSGTQIGMTSSTAGQHCVKLIYGRVEVAETSKEVG